MAMDKDWPRDQNKQELTTTTNKKKNRKEKKGSHTVSKYVTE